MSENKRYFWMKLKEDFFEEDTIQWIEEQENGATYALFYLKLCLKSLKNDGRLIRYVGDYLMPYDKKALAKLTNTEPDTVAVAMNLFQKIGLVEILEGGEIYLTQIEEMVGTETNKAALMRRKRAEERGKIEAGNIVTQKSNNVTPELPGRYPNVTQSIESRDIESRDIESKEKETSNLIQQQAAGEPPATLQNVTTVKKTNSSQITADFEALWKLYPNKKGKGPAQKAYEKAIKSGTTRQEVEDGINRYNAYIAKNRIASKYVKHGSTFFNQEGWLDDYEDDQRDVPAGHQIPDDPDEVAASERRLQEVFDRQSDVDLDDLPF